KATHFKAAAYRIDLLVVRGPIHAQRVKARHSAPFEFGGSCRRVDCEALFAQRRLQSCLARSFWEMSRKNGRPLRIVVPMAGPGEVDVLCDGRRVRRVCRFDAQRICDVAAECQWPK